MDEVVRTGQPDTARSGSEVRVSVPFRGGVLRGEVRADPSRLLTTAEVSRLLGIKPHTWRTYVLRGQAPAPDAPDLETPVNRRLPRWRLSTVREYVQNRKRQAFKLYKG
jgi:predicted DNA-binding transcriptional regulator AlpA